MIQTEFYEPLSEVLKGLYSLVPESLEEDGSVEGEPRFPKRCTKCGSVYESPADFMENTHGLSGEERDICYLIGGQTRIFRYRNCPAPCNSTLVVVTDERRDTSQVGLKRRKLFGRVHEILNESLPGVSPGVTHSLTLYLFRAITFEGLTPLEAYVLMKKDIETKRFLGFQGEAPVLVEAIKGKVS